jgi:DNA-binding response OmpR family regulator
MKILFLEDDYNYRVSIKELLESLGYEIDDFENGNQAMDAVFSNNYDLLLLDIRVEGYDGYEIAQAVRCANIEVPIIFVTSLTDINNLSLGYELGCNDYIRKPFSMKELVFRIEETIRRYHFKSVANILKLPFDYEFDLKQELLTLHGKEIFLSENEKKIIVLLVKNLNRFVSSEIIKEAVWSEKSVGDSEIRMTLKKIRDKTNKDLIVNVRGLGYKIEKKQS